MQVFISYSRKNEEAAKTLAQDIQQMDRTVWLDQEIQGGQQWWEHLLSRIFVSVTHLSWCFLQRH